MRCHDVDYAILGDAMPVVEIELDPGETVIAEAGALTYMEDGISFETKMGDGSDAGQGVMTKLFGAGKRMIMGEFLFTTHFSNHQSRRRRVAFAAPYPGNIVTVNMAAIGEELICQKDAFLCAALGTKLDITLNRKLGAGLFGGEGFILQRLEGDGMAFIQAGGNTIKNS